MESVESKKKINSGLILCIIFGAVILFEFVSYVYLNFFPQTIFIDEDFAKLARHTMEMGRQHTLFLKCWDYITTGELDCAAVLALPFYMITGNIYISFAIANILNMVLWSVVIWNLLKHTRVSAVYRLLAIALVLALYDLGMLAYSNMMFFCGGQYVYKTLIPVLLIYLMILPAEKRWKPGMILLYALLLFLLFLTGISSGLYVFACGIAPILICTIVYSVYDHGKKDILYRIILLATAFIAFAMGLLLCGTLQVNPNTEKMTITSTIDYFSVFFNTMNNQIEVFNPFMKKDIKATSLDGVVVCVRWVITGIILCGYALLPKAFAIASHKKEFDHSSKERFFTESLLISVAVWNFVILFLTQSSPRYHLIGVIPLMLSSVLVLERFFCKMVKWLEIAFLILLALGIQLMNTHTSLSMSKEYFNRFDYYWFDMRECDSLFRLFDDMGVETVFLIDSSKEAELLRTLDSDRVYMTYFSAYSAVSCYDYYLSARDRSTFSEKNAVMVMDEVYENIPEYVKNYYTQIAVFGSYKILYSENNPFDGISLVEKGLHTVDLPTTPGYTYDGTIDSMGYLHSATMGSVMKSAGIAAKSPFSYVMHYELSEGSQAQLIVYEENAEEGIYDVIILDSDSASVTLECSPGNYMFEVQKTDMGEMTIGQMEFKNPPIFP